MQNTDQGKYSPVADVGIQVTDAAMGLRRTSKNEKKMDNNTVLL